MSTNAEKIRATQAEAALAIQDEEMAHRREIQLILGLNIPSRDHLGDIHRFGDDCVAQVIGPDRTLWVAVVDSRHPHLWHNTMDEALVHLLALRHGERNTQAHTYACRVLQVPVTE